MNIVAGTSVSSRLNFAKNVRVMHPDGDRILFFVHGAHAARMVSCRQADLVSERRKTHGAIRLSASMLDSPRRSKGPRATSIRSYMGQQYTFLLAVKDGDGNVVGHITQFHTEFLFPDDRLKHLFQLSVLENLSCSPDQQYSEQVR